MNTTKPQPDPSPAQREERLITKPGLNCFYICSMGRRRSYIAKTCGDDEQDAADAQRLVNGWNALPDAESALRFILECAVASSDKTVCVLNLNQIRRTAETALTAIRESKGK